MHGDEYNEMNLSEGKLAVETSVVIPVRNRECARKGDTKWSWRGLLRLAD